MASSKQLQANKQKNVEKNIRCNDLSFSVFWFMFFVFLIFALYFGLEYKHYEKEQKIDININDTQKVKEYLKQLNDDYNCDGTIFYWKNENLIWCNSKKCVDGGFSKEVIVYIG